MLRNQTGLLIALLILGASVSAIFIIGDFIQGAENRTPNSGVGTEAERLYRVNCSGCHGVGGEGKMELLMAPALNASGQTWMLTNQEILHLISNGGEVMPAFQDRLSPQELTTIITYFQAWWDEDQMETHLRLSEAAPDAGG